MYLWPGEPCIKPNEQEQGVTSTCLYDLSGDRAFGYFVLGSSMEKSEEYFKSYEDLAVHRLMLDDAARVSAYKEAIDSMKDYLAGKVVMDVGAGTGILSLFCAQAGAKKVYAVEASGIASVAEKLIEANNFSHIIQVINQRVEDVVLPEDRVDAIVSEWMGFYLLHESMLDSVLTARDRFLAPGGKMLPESATLLACPCSLPRFHAHWRDDFYGLDLSAFGELERSSRGSQPLITDVGPDDLLAQPITLWQFDLYKVTSKELDRLVDRRLVLLDHDGSYEGVCLWFECCFPGDSHCLSTSPASERTHWQQTALVLPQGEEVEAFECVAWELVLERSRDEPRQYNIHFSVLDPDMEPHPIPCDCISPRCALIGHVVEEYEKTVSTTE